MQTMDGGIEDSQLMDLEVGSLDGTLARGGEQLILEADYN